MNQADDLSAAVEPVVAAFEKLRIRYCVGGSVASSFHGASRSTMDVDLLCELTEEQAPDFLACFDGDYYVSEPAIREAIRRKSCFNLIHLPTSYKVDIFVSPQRPFDLERMNRATVESLGADGHLKVRMTSAEDSIISKLEWFRVGNETSERQWEDVSRLARMLSDTADVAYLRSAAASVGVADLLERLLQQS